MDMEAAHLSLTSGNENDQQHGDPSKDLDKVYQKRYTLLRLST
jgi:hypothetical protein